MSLVVQRLAVTAALLILHLVVLPAAAATISTALSFGSNDSGQTGLNTTSGSTLLATPINTTNLAGKTITQVAGGRFHSLLLADDGSVFSSGSNFNGQTGLNTTSGNTLLATLINTTNLAGKTITQVAGGAFHSLLLADDGSVFSFGFNGNGQTGLNTTVGNTLVATPIDTTNLTIPGSRVTDISAGYQHSLLTTAVPEPASGTLLLVMGVGFVARRRPARCRCR